MPRMSSLYRPTEVFMVFLGKQMLKKSVIFKTEELFKNNSRGDKIAEKTYKSDL